jgi:hypothetical protein
MNAFSGEPNFIARNAKLAQNNANVIAQLSFQTAAMFVNKGGQDKIEKRHANATVLFVRVAQKRWFAKMNKEIWSIQIPPAL